MRWIALAAMAMTLGCSVWSGYVETWKDKPGQKHATLPIREQIIGTRYYVSVRVLEGDWQPMCMVPDAANEIACIFHYGYLEHGMIMNSDGYLFMDGPTARQACSDAMWSVGPDFSGPRGIQACALALMTHRWMVDTEYGVNREDQ